MYIAPVLPLQLSNRYTANQTNSPKFKTRNITDSVSFGNKGIVGNPTEIENMLSALIAKIHDLLAENMALRGENTALKQAVTPSVVTKSDLSVEQLKLDVMPILERNREVFKVGDELLEKVKTELLNARKNVKAILDEYGIYDIDCIGVKAGNEGAINNIRELIKQQGGSLYSGDIYLKSKQNLGGLYLGYKNINTENPYLFLRTYFNKNIEIYGNMSGDSSFAGGPEIENNYLILRNASRTKVTGINAIPHLHENNYEGFMDYCLSKNQIPVLHDKTNDIHYYFNDPGYPDPYETQHFGYFWDNKNDIIGNRYSIKLDVSSNEKRNYHLNDAGELESVDITDVASGNVKHVDFMTESEI